MTRSLFPRSYESLDVKAAEVLGRYSRRTGWTPVLPVPIEHIIETEYDLRILWNVIDEQPNEKILAMLEPSERRIVMNETHADVGGILANIGPVNFSLAHELGHWLFDAVSPDQGEMFAVVEPVFCRGTHSTEEASRIREGNADRFAAALLMPRSLLPVADLAAMDDGQLRAAAESYGVSYQALCIKLDKLKPPQVQVDRFLP